MAYRAFGPFNGLLPEPTGMAIGYVRDPKRAPFLNYVQMVPAPERAFQWFRLDPDEPVRVVSAEAGKWAPGDYRPTGKGAMLRGDSVSARTERWDEPFTIDQETQEAWTKAGYNPRQFLQMHAMSKAMLKRAIRITTAMSGASWGSNTATVQSLLGLGSPIYWDQSSGVELDPVTSLPNPAFQVIKKTLNRIRRRIDQLTNGAVADDEFNLVIPPKVANAVSECGEIVNALKQSQYADKLINWRNQKWNLPDAYAGFNWVVEDSIRVSSLAAADGTTEAALTSGEREYMLNDDTCYAVSRVGGLDGGYGGPNFSTVQLYHLGDGVRVEAFSEPKHHLIEGHVVMDDVPIVASTRSGFKLTSVLSPSFT